MLSALERSRDVVQMHGFRRIVADAPGRAQKKDRRGKFFRQSHGIVSRAAGHAMGLATRFLHGMLDLLRQKRIHCHGMLGEERPPLHGHAAPRGVRSEEHTSELQSHLNLVCRLLLEKKKIRKIKTSVSTKRWRYSSKTQ